MNIRKLAQTVEEVYRHHLVYANVDSLLTAAARLRRDLERWNKEKEKHEKNSHHGKS